MMNYNEFKEELLKNLASQGKEIALSNEQETNVSLDARAIVSDANILTKVYINQLYNEYRETQDFYSCVSSTIACLEQDCKKNYGKVSFALMRDNITFMLINANSNEKLLKDVPHRMWNDLAIVYHLGILKITNEFAEILSLTEEDLYHLARENTLKLTRVVVSTMRQTLLDIRSEFSEEEFYMMLLMMPDKDEDGMYVISNEPVTNGASAILYTSILETLAEKLQDNLYLLLSSIHEIIAVRASIATVGDLKAMVEEANLAYVLPEEKLSDNVYYYDRQSKKVTLVTYSTIAVVYN